MATAPKKPLLVLTVASEWDGRPLTDPKMGIVGISRIDVNRTRWSAPAMTDQLILRDGDKIILRRDGRFIYVERE